jgi:membrane-associated phospholipid phosphatase
MLYPLFTTTYLMVAFCMLYSHYRLPLSTAYWWFAIGGTAFFTFLVPLIILVVMKLQGRITDLDVSKREERLVPFVYAIISFGFWCAYLESVLHVPDFMFWTAICSVLAILLCTLISLRWKISAHLASMGGVVGMTVGYILYFGLNAPYTICGLLLLSLLLMYARIYLRAHTPMQAVAGFLLGLTITLIPNFILLYE